jgi:hypothetical protein
MRKSWGVAIGAAAVTLAVLTPGVALAATDQPTPPTPNGDTATTFDVGPTGTLTISAPVSADLSTGVTTPVTPGGQIVGNLGVVTVTDLRSLVDTGWTASVSSTDFTTGGGTSAETIPAADLAYDPTPPRSGRSPASLEPPCPTCPATRRRPLPLPAPMVTTRPPGTR